MKRKLAGFLVFVLLLASVNITAFAEGETPAPDTYRINYDRRYEEEVPHATASVATGSNAAEAKESGVYCPFESGEELRFTLESPEDRKDSVPYVEIVWADEGNGRLQSWGEEPDFEVSGEDGVYTFSYTPDAQGDSFDVNLWWSGFSDWFGPEPEIGSSPEAMCAFLELYTPDGGGQIAPENEDDIQSSIYSRYVEEEGGGERGEGDWRANIKNAAKNKVLLFTPEPDFELDRILLNGTTEISAESLTEDEGVYSYQIKEADWTVEGGSGAPWLCVEAFFVSSGDPGEGPGQQGENIAGYIREQKFVFGDWDKDGDADMDDVTDGIRDQVFYSGDTYRASRAYFGIESPDDLQLTAEETSPAETLKVTDRDGNEHLLPVYDYEIVLTPTEESEPEESRRTEYTETVTGKAALFSFTETIDQDYIDYSDTDLIMEVTKGETTVRRLVNARVKGSEEAEPYTSPDVTDLKTGKTGPGAEEGTIAMTGAYDVKKEENGYTRSVSVYGNGAGLDAMFSREADTAFFTAQGRNENLVSRVNENREEAEKLDQIFATFTFLQPGSRTVEVSGSGAGGNTPAWEYGYSKFATAASGAKEALEVESYFGNLVYTFRPVLFGGDVKRISNLQPAGNVPAEALTIINFDGAEEEDKRWVVRFNSDYYDEMTFRLTYEMNDQSTEERYITLHRVGIDIEETAISREAREEAEGLGDETVTVTLMHGTTDGPDYEASLKAEKILYATYYYPEAEDTTDYVGLYVTYTWKDGSVTRKYIENRPDLNMDREEVAKDIFNCQTSDFILYEGKNASAPVKVEVIAIVEGSDEETFAGAKLGAGRGVEYTLGTNG